MSRISLELLQLARDFLSRSGHELGKYDRITFNDIFPEEYVPCEHSQTRA